MELQLFAVPASEEPEPAVEDWEEAATNGASDGEEEEMDEKGENPQGKKRRRPSDPSEAKRVKPKLVRGTEYSSFIPKEEEDVSKEPFDPTLDIPEFEQFEEIATAKRDLEQGAREITPDSSRSPSPLPSSEETASGRSKEGVTEIESKTDETAISPDQKSAPSETRKPRFDPDEATTPPYSPPGPSKSSSGTLVRRVTVPIERDYLRRRLEMDEVGRFSAKVFEISSGRQGLRDWEELFGTRLTVQGRISPEVVQKYLKQVSLHNHPFSLLLN